MKTTTPRTKDPFGVHLGLIGTAFYALLTSPFWMGTALGLPVVHAWSSRMALLGFLAALFVPPAVVWAKRRWRTAGILAASSLVLVGAGWALRSVDVPVPSHSGQVAAFSVEMGDGKVWGPWDVLPEMDWIRAGGAAGKIFDVTGDQSRYLLEETEKFETAMAADPDFAALPSQIPRAIDGLLGLPQRSGHYVLLTATPQSPKRKGLVVFLHGSAANFRAYAWLLRDVVLKTGWDVIVPTYGFGDWNRPDGLAAIEAAVASARARAHYGTGGIVAAGVSNGGRGLTRLIAFGNVPLKSVVFISPVMESTVMETPGFKARAKGLPVTVVAGLKDDRIPAAYVEFARQLLVDEGAQVTAVPFPEGDHFILFSQSGAILEEIEKAIIQP